MELRPYQIDVTDRARALVAAGKRRVILQCATGGGKTVCAGHMIRLAALKGSRVLFLAHARELILQAARKIDAFNVPFGVIMAGVGSDPDAQVQIASKDTLVSRVFRRQCLQIEAPDLIVVDECHRSMGGWYQRLLNTWPRAVVIGLTATPVRGDGVGLGDWWEGMVEAVPTSQLVREGHLVPVEAFGPFQPNMTGAATSGGEWTKAAAARVMDRPKLVGDIVRHWLDHASGRPTICFATRVQHSMHLRDEFLAAGVNAVHLDAKTPVEERQRILDQFADRQIQVLLNVNVLTEGWDCPLAEVMIDARPRKRIGGFLQAAGRILRPAPGKSRALILDHAGNIARHGFPDEDQVWSLDTSSSIEDRIERDRAAGKKAAPTTCPRCFALYRGRSDCPNCGMVPKRQTEPAATQAGKLVPIQRGAREEASAEDRQRFWRRCLGVMAHKGYSCRAASCMYKQHFGDWPRAVEPLPVGSQWEMRVADLFPQFVTRKDSVHV